MVYVAFSHSTKCKYKSTFWSKTTVFLAINGLFTFVFPFVIAFYTGNGIWIKYETYREQPTVKFKHKYFLLIETGTSADNYNDNDDGDVICGTFTKLITRPNRCSLVTVEEMDDNKDGKVDSIDFDLMISNVTTDNYRSIYLMLFFDYKLNDKCKLHAESIGIVSSSSNTMILPDDGKTNGLNVQAELKLMQKRPLNCKRRIILTNEQQVITDDLLYGAEVFENRLINYAARRNISTKLNVLSSRLLIGDDATVGKTLRLSATIYINEDTIVFKTSFWELIKWAWIQYFSILTLFLIGSRKLKSFMFQRRILPTFRTDN